MKNIKLFENYQLDKILDKISDSGIESLSKIEKEYLDRHSEGTQKEIEYKFDYIDKSPIHIGDFIFTYSNIEHDEDEIRIYGKLFYSGYDFKGFISCSKIGKFEYADFYLTTDLSKDIYEVIEENDAAGEIDIDKIEERESFERACQKICRDFAEMQFNENKKIKNKHEKIQFNKRKR